MITAQSRPCDLWARSLLVLQGRWGIGDVKGHLWIWVHLIWNPHPHKKGAQIGTCSNSTRNSGSKVGPKRLSHMGITQENNYGWNCTLLCHHGLYLCICCEDQLLHDLVLFTNNAGTFLLRNSMSVQVPTDDSKLCYTEWAIYPCPTCIQHNTMSDSLNANLNTLLHWWNIITRFNSFGIWI